MSGRRRRGEDDFADERSWLAEEDESAPWPPEAEDSWADGPEQASGGGRRGRHSVAGEPGVGWEPTVSLPRQPGPGGRPSAGPPPGWDEPGWEEPGWGGSDEEDRYALRREPAPPPSRRAAPWDQEPPADDGYPGSTARNGLTGDRFAGPPGQQAAGRGSRRAGRRATPPARDPYAPGGYQDAGDRYAAPDDPSTNPLQRPSGRAGDPGGRYISPAGGRARADSPAGYGDPGGRYGDQGDGYRDPGDGYGDPGTGYRDPGGQYGDPGGRDRDPSGRDGALGGRDSDPGGWDRDPPSGNGVPSGRDGDPGGRYRDPAAPYGDRAGRNGDPGAPYGDPAGRPGDRGYGYASPRERPDPAPGRRPGSRGEYPGAEDGYPPPERADAGRFPGADARRGGPGGDEYGDEYLDEYGERPGRDQAAGPGGLPAGHPAGGARVPRGRAGGSGRADAGYGGQDRDQVGYGATHGAGDREAIRGRAAERDDPGRDDQGGYTDEGWPFGGDAGDDHSGGRPRRKRRGRWAGPSSLLVVAAIILIPLIIGGIYAYRVISSHYDPPNYSGAGTGTYIFQVKSGDNSETVGNRLASDGVVASSRALVLAAEHSSNASALEPGYYRLHKHMNAQLAWNLLVSPSARVQLKVTIPEGWRATQILAELGKHSGISASDYTKAIKDTSALGLPSYAKGNPEGYLYPATYEIQPGMTATSVLKAMVSAFNQEASSVNLPKEAARGNLTPAEAIVVASLAQAEGGKDSDFPKITRVIYNRLQAHMPLDLDSTVLYALHKYGIVASDQDLRVKSPYNTYARKGLPPAPIDSPGNAAIQAALHPAKGNWLYFVTVNPKTRQTDFTSSPAVFQQFKNELQQYLSSHGG